MRNISVDKGGDVLVACRDIPYLNTLVRQIEADGHRTERCHDAKGVLRLVGRRSFDVTVLDLELGQEGDIDLLSFIRRQRPETQIILLFEMSKIDRAIDGIRRGAYFYLPLTCNPSDVALVVDKALRRKRTESTLSEYQQNIFEELVGGAAAMRRVVDLITRVAPTDSTVLLLGESGTGKEILAHAVHRLSPRREMPFVALNCAALPETLLESEMFGHVKGSFTGAESDKRGLFEEADGGSIFLDEIGDMPPLTQAKVLRVLQNGEVRPVGSTVSKRVDVRVIAATNRDLVEAVHTGKFREDLYFRLNVIQIRIPPLRERLDALPTLLSHFIHRFNQRFRKSIRGVDDQALALLRNYPFPGNIRELENIIAHAVIVSDGDVIGATDLPDAVRGGGVQFALPDHTVKAATTLDDIERQTIASTLEQFGGNQTETARKLGISRSTLWRKMREYGIRSAAKAGSSQESHASRNSS